MNKLYFLHIPKTAGTSLLNVLERHYAASDIFPPSQIPQVNAESMKDVKKYSLFRGHFTYNLVDYLPDDVKVITFVREPVARTISHLKHVKFLTRHWLHKELPLADMSLDDMLQEPLVQQFVRDYQVRRIGCDVDYNTQQDSKLILQEPTLLDQTHVQKAQDRLEKCFFVGVTDQFEKSVARLYDLLGWEEQAAVPAINKAQERDVAEEEISEKSLSLIAELTALDKVLYEFASDMFGGMIDNTKRKVS